MDIDQQLDNSLDDIVAEKGASAARSGGPRRQRGATSRRSQPYKKTGPKRTYREGPVAIEAGASDRRNLKVSGSSVPKIVAGSIAHVCRAGSAPAVMATGDVAINQAIKSIAVARRYLEDDDDDVDIKVQPRFKSRSKMLTLSIEKTRKVRDLRDEFVLDTDMIVKSTTDGSKTAGAIAARAREGTACAIVSNGSAGVFQLVRAISIARQYLTDDNKDLYFVPAMVDTKRPDGSKSVMLRCRILVHDC